MNSLKSKVGKLARAVSFYSGEDLIEERAGSTSRMVIEEDNLGDSTILWVVMYSNQTGAETRRYNVKHLVWVELI